MAKESLEALCQQARQAVAEKQYDQARQHYRQALGLRNDLPDVHYGMATVCFLLNDLTTAAHHFKEVCRLDPLRAGAYINLGAVYNRLDQLDEAVTTLRRGIQLDGTRAEGYYNLGLVYKRKGQIDLAIGAYQEAARVNPGMADAHLNLANLFLDKGQYPLAVANYKKALQVRPNWEKALNGLDRAEALQNQQDAPSQAAQPVTAEAALHALADAVPDLDPERAVDPNIHANQLTVLHRVTIDTDKHGQDFLDVLQKEVEPAIKDLSSCLLKAKGPAGELDDCLQKFEAALASLRAMQQQLVDGMGRIRQHGEQLLKS